MLFVYIVAITMAIAVNYGCLVLLSIPELHEPKFMLFMFILVVVVGGTSWAIYTMFNAAKAELVYWF